MDKKMYRMATERRKKKQGKTSEKMERRYRGHGRKDMDEKDERQRGVVTLIGGLCSAVDCQRLQVTSNK